MLVLLAGCGGGGEQGVRTERFDVQSHLLDDQLEQAAVVPRGETKGRPILLLLHGRGMSPSDMATKDLREAVRGLGERAPIVVLPNGGDHSYFHDRRDGAWGSYVVGEVLPAAVRRYRADPKRVAIGGFSMGGFGALDLARAAPGLFCAVGGHEAALWFRASQTPEGAFDDAEDFHRHDILGAPGEPRSLRSRARLVGCRRDRSLPAVDDGAFARARRRGLPHLARGALARVHPDAYGAVPQLLCAGARGLSARERPGDRDDVAVWVGEVRGLVAPASL